MFPSNSGATPEGTSGRLTRMVTPLDGPVRTATALQEIKLTKTSYLADSISFAYIVHFSILDYNNDFKEPFCNRKWMLLLAPQI